MSDLQYLGPCTRPNISEKQKHCVICDQRFPALPLFWLILIKWNWHERTAYMKGGVCNTAPTPNILTNFRPEYFLICTTRLSTVQNNKQTN